MVSQEEPLIKIRAYDFSLIRERLLKDERIAPGFVDQAIEEFRKYLTLLALGHRGVAMCSSVVDEVWHVFILFTQDYASFCQDVYGQFIHHRPATSNNPIAPEARIHFLAAYQDTFGALPSLWLKTFADSCNDITVKSSDPDDKCEPSTNCQPKCSVPSGPYCKED